MEKLKSNNIFCSKVEKRNCDGLCCQETCGNEQTHFFRVEINGVKLIVGLCEKHAKEIQ